MQMNTFLFYLMRLLAAIIVLVVGLLPFIIFVLLYLYVKPSGMWKMTFIVLGGVFELIIQIVWLVQFAFVVGRLWSKMFPKKTRINRIQVEVH